jgi:hypothetical protein
MYEVADKARFALQMERARRRFGDKFDIHPRVFRLPYQAAAWVEEHRKVRSPSFSTVRLLTTAHAESNVSMAAQAHHQLLRPGKQAAARGPTLRTR